MIGIGIGINRLRSGAFSPASLFSAGEQGFWFDHSDLSTLFQDAAGTTPVTTPGQTVNLKLDKSQGLVLGPDLAADILGSTSGWVFVGAATVAGGEIVFTTPPSALVSAVYNPIVANGKRYEVRFTLSGTGLVSVRVGSGGDSYFNVAAPGTYVFRGQASGGTPTNISFASAVSAVNNFVGTVSGLSVRLLPGNHAVQSTALQRPTFGLHPVTGIRNLLTYTEQFDNAVWGKSSVTVSGDKVVPSVADTYHEINQEVVATSGRGAFYAIEAKPDGYNFLRVFREIIGIGFDVDLVNLTVSNRQTEWATPTITLLEDGWVRIQSEYIGVRVQDRISFQPMPSALSVSTFSGDGVSGVRLRKPQVELDTFTAYQRVTSQYDVYEEGVARIGYLQTDGVDDGMVTPVITPGTDKAQVFVGVRKLSDAAGGAVLIFGNAFSAINGSLGVEAPRSSTLELGAYARGTALSQASIDSAAFSSPISGVYSVLFDISGDYIAGRWDGSSVFSSAADLGTGNFSAQTANLGKTLAGGFPFNGRSYQEVVRFGPNLTDAQIAAMESFIAGKTGVSL